MRNEPAQFVMLFAIHFLLSLATMYVDSTKTLAVETTPPGPEVVQDFGRSTQ